jgi:hypothetical protein
MLPEARTDKLVYVSDNVGKVVYVLSYPQGKLIGTLSGFGSPVGLCGDRTLRVPGGFFFGCAIHPLRYALVTASKSFAERKPYRSEHDCADSHRHKERQQRKWYARQRHADAKRVETDGH